LAHGAGQVLYFSHGQLQRQMVMSRTIQKGEGWTWTSKKKRCTLEGNLTYPAREKKKKSGHKKDPKKKHRKKNRSHEADKTCRQHGRREGRVEGN